MVPSWIALITAHGALDRAVLEFRLLRVPEKNVSEFWVARHVPKRRGSAN